MDTMLDKDTHPYKDSTPKMAKGGVYAPADVNLIKDALLFYVQHNGNITEAEESQAANLLHRLNSRI